MSRRTKHSHVNPAVPPYLTYAEQLLVSQRVREECEYRQGLVEEVRAGQGTL